MAKEKLIEVNTSSKSNKIGSIDTAQLEYTAGKLFSYGTIAFSIVLGLASLTYLVVKQLKKD